MFYEVMQKDRFFNRHQKYVDIDWKSLSVVSDAFRKRIDDWYLEPIRRLKKESDGGHFAFTAMALNCLMIDTLSQYEYGLAESDGRKFKQFVRDYLKAYSGQLKVPIQYPRLNKKTGAIITFAHKTVEDVLWAGFRCGILHQAHTAPYCGVRPAGHRMSQRVSGFVKSGTSGSDVGTVIVNPWRLFKDVEKVFHGYIKRLNKRGAAHDPLRAHFKEKFTDSFGVDVLTATL